MKRDRTIALALRQIVTTVAMMMERRCFFGACRRKPHTMRLPSSRSLRYFIFQQNAAYRHHVDILLANRQLKRAAWSLRRDRYHPIG
jgi:hypothetical protein